MKILWYTRVFFPDLSARLGLETSVVGGWTFSLAKDLIASNIELHVATTSPNHEDIRESINGINYYVLKSKKPITEYDDTLEKKFKNLVGELKPDVVHIHGTEYAHGLSLMRSCPNEKFVVSIQGLVGPYSKYYLGGISTKEIINNISFRDILKWDTLIHQKNKFASRGKLEREYLERTTNVLGRTSWDFSHARAVNPNCNYHFCNRTLRYGFYQSKKWTIDNAKKHSIFLSQAGYPIKGMHKVLDAVALIKNDFPDVTIRVGGNNIIKKDTFKDKLRIRGYGNYISKLIRKYDLENNVTFLGRLSEKEMINEYLNANVFICPSSIENSPNSLGEAQILGVPLISSYVGGVCDMVIDKKTGLLYRFEEVELLAEHLRNIFNNLKIANELSFNGIEEAEKRHNQRLNNEAILKAYDNIVNS